jgi:D-beta-D-heptose 7-phosphate kinase/D-beta-D-heptose 1-phosphate adenosyltransferase
MTFTRQPKTAFVPALVKVCDRSELARRVAEWRERGDVVVFTNGCFDLLHVGHVMSLEYARQAGDRLIVALNSDRSVRALKGPRRPVVAEDERAFILAALGCVDAVIIFDEDTPESLLKLLRPDVLVKGGDYGEEQVVGREIVRSYGGRIVIAPLIPGRSTTTLIAHVGQNSQPDQDFTDVVGATE